VSAHTLQAPVGEVFRLQDELAQRIVASLSPSLAGGEGSPRRGAPASPRAYEFYLRANEVARGWSHAAVARDLYLQCVEEDAAFAPAWAKLGRCHRLLAKYYLEEPRENLARAEEAFRRALEIDPGLPFAHKLYAHHEAEMGRSRDAMVRLIGLARSNRNDPELFTGLVHACRYCGLLDASEAAHREARRLDPHAWTSVVFTHWALARFEAVLEEVVETPDYIMDATALHALGQTADGVRLISEKLEQLAHAEGRSSPPVVQITVRSMGAFLAGGQEASEAMAETAVAHTDPEAVFVYGICQAYLGDEDRALATLARAVEAGYHLPQALTGHPWLAGLRETKRLDPLFARAEAGRQHALRAFRTRAARRFWDRRFPRRPRLPERLRRWAATSSALQDA